MGGEGYSDAPPRGVPDRCFVTTTYPITCTRRLQPTCHRPSWCRLMKSVSEETRASVMTYEPTTNVCVTEASRSAELVIATGCLLYRSAPPALRFADGGRYGEPAGRQYDEYVPGPGAPRGVTPS